MNSKYPTKFAPADWHTSNHMIASSAERQQSIARDVREQSKIVQIETDNKTRWTQHDTNTKLDGRISEITQWKENLSRTLTDTEKEIEKLTETKERCEKALEEKALPLDVVLECLSLREQRVSIDLVRDDVEAELHKELETIERIRSTLHANVNSAFEQICVLQDCHQGLCIDLTDKHSALAIDSECLNLSDQSKAISLQKDPTRIKKNIMTPDQWVSYSAHNTSRANAEMRTSIRIRESINHTIQQTGLQLEAQWTTTNYAFRKRIHEMEQAIHELEWQQKNTETEVREVEDEISCLEKSLALKIPPMMVTQTRLENRIQRPNVELCRDQTQYQMVEEIAKIGDSQQALKEKLAVTQYTLGALQRTLDRIKRDLDVKTNSLELDQQCMQVREKLAQDTTELTASQ
ncbi:tektin-2-like [Halichondria panicea]|uniref:tektin-2-like n=1 Tax=Halichondria panicea TaxID=6063 RepID=UPI00312B8B75